MRGFLVFIFALVFLGAAGLLAVVNFGGNPPVMVAEQRAPVAKIAPPLAPPADHDVGAAHPNAPDTLKTDKAAASAPTGAGAAAPGAGSAPGPAPIIPPATTEASKVAPHSMARAAPAPQAGTNPGPSASAESAKKDSADAFQAASVPEPKTQLAAPAPSGAAPSAPTTSPPPPVATASTASAPPTPAAAPTQTAAAVSMSEEFKTRKVAYNRPPATLYVDRPIDISLVIDATAAADPAAQLQGFPGQVVQRDVSLPTSDAVSAVLRGTGFDIINQSPELERQTLSSKAPNRWQWRVTPTQAGTQTLMLEIFGYRSGSLDAEPLDAYSDKITVQVKQLDAVIKMAKTYQPVIAIFGGVAGLFSAFLALLRHRRETKKV